jgi:hypothetical protein
MPRRQKRCGNWPAPRSAERNGQFFEVALKRFALPKLPASVSTLLHWEFHCYYIHIMGEANFLAYYSRARSN